MSNIIESLKWRYATKKFDKTKKLSSQQIEEIKEVLKLTASSYGLQPYKFLIISNQDLKEKLKVASYNQDQLSDASHIVLFCSMTDYNGSNVDDHIINIANTNNKDISSLKTLSDGMKSKVSKMSDEEKAIWIAKQNYIALGNLLSAAAQMEIDACPMEGFEADKYNEILGLDRMGLKVNVIAALGFRDKSDKYANEIKVRKAEEDLFIEI